MLAVPMKDIVRIHASSGTTGKPTVGAYTKEDIENWSDFVARIVTASGVTSDDIIQISFEMCIRDRAKRASRLSARSVLNGPHWGPGPQGVNRPARPRAAT